MKRRYIHDNVPYRSQWGNPDFNKKIIDNRIDPCQDPTWVNAGFISEDEYRFWSRRICGIACLESILDFTEIPHKNRKSMLFDAIQRGAYVISENNIVNGLIYDPFCKWIYEEYKIKTKVYKNQNLHYVADNISQFTMAIASVSTEIRAPTMPNFRQGGHLILIYGADEKNIYFHNPSGTPPFQKNVCLSIDEAERFHARRGILLQAPQAQQYNFLKG